MEAFIPFDATEDEISEINVIQDELPHSLLDAVTYWIKNELSGGQTAVPYPLVLELQSALRITFRLNADYDYVGTDALMQRIRFEGDRFILRVVDWILWRTSFDSFGEAPQSVVNLARHFIHNGSSLQVVEVHEENCFRLKYRIPQGVDQAAQAALDNAPQFSGQKLAAAWEALRGLDPDPDKAFTEGIKAVELAANNVVTPRAQKVRLSMIVQSLKDKKNWRLILDRRDDGIPNHREMLIAMMETLAFAQQGRHGGEENSLEAAQAHVMLASVLVGWFSTGAVIMNEQ